MDDQLKKQLDELASRPLIVRKISIVKTDECPIWNPFEQIWEESDNQLRDRLIHKKW